MTQWQKFIKRNKPVAKWLGGPKFEAFMHDAPIEMGTIGVCLNDTKNPPQFYQFAGFVDTKTIELVKLGENLENGKLKTVPIKLFWPLT